MNIKLLIGISVALSLGACASVPVTSPVLANARATVGAAEADPNVGKYAPLELQAARNDLQTAETAAATAKPELVDHPAYLATQNARLAQAHASAKADDARVAAGQAERDQIRLAARTNELRTANAATGEARNQRDLSNAESQRSQAESARLQARWTASTPSPRRAAWCSRSATCCSIRARRS